MRFWEGCAAFGPTCPAACAACLQRGDAEVSQKLWRVVRACVELGEANPIEQIHDQVGAGTLTGHIVLNNAGASARMCHVGDRQHRWTSVRATRKH